MGIDDELGETESFTAQVKGISELRVLSDESRSEQIVESRCDGKIPDELQVHVVIQMQVVQVLEITVSQRPSIRYVVGC